ncbi:hypothetical protein UVI_02015180 [Ustilaginoidea virens]|uniref:CCD97-like C-terminal domain-containing protein n=1 Tax=Ustilaginoidea virens TaxID=1159556 RepID=A0A1B5KS04_USTVR|nr:hypothetical protein UVI_02015180 [Ustilaginoidea virens]
MCAKPTALDDEASTTYLYDKQVPRPARSPAKAAQIKVQNRRREYLQRHPSYLAALDHELAVLYERLIKRHQSTEERQREGRAKGYGRVLGADLARGETRLTALATEAAGERRTDFATRPAWRAATDVDNAWDEEAGTREDGMHLWQEFLRERFVRGGDEEFDYGVVDGDEELDVDARRMEEDRWFEEEDPGWTGEASGETGVQDF